MPPTAPATTPNEGEAALVWGLNDAELAVRLVRQAGALAVRMRAGDLTAEHKTSASDLVTAADRAAEDWVTATLRRERPGDGLLGEEGATDLSGTGRRWIIDPIDGTYNFHSGLAYWCSALALEDSEGLVLGAVHQPSSGETWVGGRDMATTLQGEAVAPLAERPLGECSIATHITPTTLTDPDVSEVLRVMVTGAATPRAFGSGTCDLAGVASGRIGVWVQHECPAWDWLPGKALVDAAGGRTEVVEHRRHRWYLAGDRRAVGELVELLLSA